MAITNDSRQTATVVGSNTATFLPAVNNLRATDTVFEQTREGNDRTVKLGPFWLEQSLSLATLIVWWNGKGKPQKDIFVRHPNDDNKNVLQLRVWTHSSYLSNPGCDSSNHLPRQIAVYSRK